MKTTQPAENTGHRYVVGNMVRLARSLSTRNSVSDKYKVLELLPEREGEFQYRIKSDLDPYQRIAKEVDLDRA
jgi:hypothetical protein